MIISRRGFLGGLGAALIAAPAIVRATSIMPVRAIVLPRHPLYDSDSWQAIREKYYSVDGHTGPTGFAGDVGFSKRSSCLEAMDEMRQFGVTTGWRVDRIEDGIAILERPKLMKKRGTWVSEVRPLENWPGARPR